MNENGFEFDREIIPGGAFGENTCEDVTPYEEKQDPAVAPADEPVPDEYICPITAEIMEDPVSTADGQTYEKKAIQKWLSTHDTSPLTNAPLKNKKLTPNIALRSLINNFKKKHPLITQKQQQNAEKIKELQEQLEILKFSNSVLEQIAKTKEEKAEQKLKTLSSENEELKARNANLRRRAERRKAPNAPKSEIAPSAKESKIENANPSPPENSPQNLGQQNQNAADEKSPAKPKKSGKGKKRTVFNLKNVVGMSSLVILSLAALRWLSTSSNNNNSLANNASNADTLPISPDFDINSQVLKNNGSQLAVNTSHDQYDMGNAPDTRLPKSNTKIASENNSEKIEPATSLPVENASDDRGTTTEIELWRIQAEKGNDIAQLNLGLLLFKDQKVEEAIYWYTRAGNQNNVQAQSNLGLIYSEGLGGNKNSAEAEKWLTKAAKQGDEVAMYNLGIFYHREGVTQNPELAVYWYKEAAKREAKLACSALGFCYDTGFGVQKDSKEATQWWTKAAELGDPIAQKRLKIRDADISTVKSTENPVGFSQRNPVLQNDESQPTVNTDHDQYDIGNTLDTRLPKTDTKNTPTSNSEKAKKAYDLFQLGNSYLRTAPKKAVEFFTHAAELGNLDAQHNLGLCYAEGRGVPKDPNQALKWWEKAAQKGYMRAQINLGLAYLQGLGVEKNLKQAAYWYKEAANQGNADSQFEMGSFYTQGLGGLAKDLEKAAEWWIKAAEQGHPSAQNNLAACYEEGLGVKKNLKRAAELWEKAAKQKHTMAQFNLGLYYQGKRDIPDLQQAVYWYTESAKQGHAKAYLYLGQCYDKGIGVNQDSDKAIKLWKKAAELGEPLAQEVLEEKGYDVSSTSVTKDSVARSPDAFFQPASQKSGENVAKAEEIFSA